MSKTTDAAKQYKPDYVKSTFELNYERLQALGILNAEGKMDYYYMQFKSKGFMDLNVNRLWNNTISLAHNFIQEGDVMSDPDMEIRINPELRTAEALSYQLSSLCLYQEVYPEPGKVDIAMKKQLNKFLTQWLINIKNQKFKLERADKDEDEEEEEAV